MKRNLKLSLVKIVFATVFSSVPVLAENGQSYKFSYETTDHYDKVNKKSPNNETYDPGSGMLSITATDISLPGNSALKVELRRILEKGYFGNTSAHFGFNKAGHAYNLDMSGENYDATLEKPIEWGLDIPHIKATVLHGPVLDSANVQDSWVNGSECIGKFPGAITVANQSDPGGQTSWVHSHEHWSGATIHIPGEITETITHADESHPEYSTDANDEVDVRVTKSNWKYRLSDCFSRADQNAHLFEKGGFVVYAPDGRRFEFDVKKEYYIEDYNYYSRVATHLTKVRRVIYASKVYDKHGNWVEYNWDGGRLNYILANDGRRIDLQYDTTESGIDYLTSATAHGKTWSYGYTPYYAHFYLSSVTYPGNKVWTYSNPNLFVATVDTSLRTSTVKLYSDGHEVPRGVCREHFPEGTSRGTATFTVTDPDGLIRTYKTQQQLFGRYGVHTSIDGYFSQEADEARLTQLNCSISNVLVEKSLEGPGLDKMTWQYSYSENDGTYVYGTPLNGAHVLAGLVQLHDDYIGDGASIVSNSNTPASITSFGLDKVKTTTIVSPDKTEVMYFNRVADSEHEDKLLVVDTFDGETNVLVKRVESTYVRGAKVSSAEHLSPYGRGVNGTNLYKLMYRSNKVSDVTTLFYDNDETDTYTTAYSHYNFYGAVGLTSETNSVNSLKKYTRQGYTHNKTTWQLNLPTTKKLSDDGVNYTTVLHNVYEKHPYYLSGAPVVLDRVYKSDEVVPDQQTVIYSTPRILEYSYHTDGTIDEVQVDGGRRRESLSGYKSGIAQTATMRSRYDADTNITFEREVDQFGQVTSITNLNGVKTGYKYDDAGYLLSKELEGETNNAWLDMVYEWSNPTAGPKRIVKRCNLNTDKDGCNGTVAFSIEEQYDALMRPKHIYQPNFDRYQNYRFDSNNNKTFESFWSDDVSEEKGTITTYDALGRVSTVTTSGLGTVTSRYLSGNRVEVTDAEDNVTTTTYLAYGAPDYSQAIEINSPESVTTTIAIDVFGNVETVTQSGFDHENNAITLTETRLYDDFNNLCAIKRSDVGNTLFKHTVGGQLEWKAEGVSNETCPTSAPASRIDYDYDYLGDLSTVDFSHSTTPDLSYERDNNGNVEIMTAGTITHYYGYNNQGLLEDETFVIGSEKVLQLDYGYNNSMHLDYMTYPDGTMVYYSPNALGKPTHVRWKKGTETIQTFANDIDYHKNLQLASFTYGNGITHSLTQHPTSQLPESIEDALGSTSVVDLTYTYDGNANITSITDGQNPAFTISELVYDGLDRLESTTGVEGGSGNTSLKYDALGNIREYTTNKRTLNYQYNDSNRLTGVTGYVSNDNKYSSFSYNDKGGITFNGKDSFVYNQANQMVSSGTNAYLYDGHNRRVKKTEGDKVEYSMYSQSGQLVYRETDVQGGSGDGINYIYLGSRLLAKMMDAVPSNDSRQRYLPFGETHDTPKDDVGFTGHKFDTSTGLSYMQARYYDPVIGRFYSNDPVDSLGHLESLQGVQGFNRYTYANNNPYKYIDPDGEAVIYAGVTPGANAGASGAAAGGVFIDISLDGVKWGIYGSVESGGSSNPAPGGDIGFEFGISTGGHEEALKGEYTTVGVEGYAGVGASVGGVVTHSSNPDYGIQITLGGGSPQASVYTHTGTGASEELGSITGREIGNAINSAGHALTETLNNAADTLRNALDPSR